MAIKRGINTAVSYLNSFFPVTLIPDKLFARAGCEGKVSSLERNLRKAAKLGKVKVIYERDSRGDMIAHYQGVPEWTPNHVGISFGVRIYTGTHENPVEIKES